MMRNRDLRLDAQAQGMRVSKCVTRPHLGVVLRVICLP